MQSVRGTDRTSYRSQRHSNREHFDYKGFDRIGGCAAGSLCQVATGSSVGEPNQPLQQRTMIFEALKLLKEADKPGSIHEPGFRWKRENYQEPQWEVLRDA